VINCAGLAACTVAQFFSGGKKEIFPEQRYAKGNYFGLEKCKAPFQHLIYPVPELHGLGVHATLDLQVCHWGVTATLSWCDSGVIVVLLWY
jgi:L-2-hydroxyglutarate oxidase LhgO